MSCVYLQVGVVDSGKFGGGVGEWGDGGVGEWGNGGVGEWGDGEDLGHPTINEVNPPDLGDKTPFRCRDRLVGVGRV